MISEDEILSDLQRVADKVGETPTQSQYQKHGEYSRSPFQRIFGSYNEAVRSAGFEPNQQVAPGTDPIDTDDLLADLQRVAEEVGYTPTQKQYEEYGEHSPHTLVRNFGSFNNAVEAAGYEPNRHHGMSKEEILSDIHDVVEKLDETPTAHQYDQHGEFSLGALNRRFGRYNNALEAAGYDPVALSGIPTNDLLADLQRVADDLGEAPTKDQYKTDGEYHPDTLAERFNGYNQAIKSAGYEPKNPRNILDIELLVDIQRTAARLGSPPRCKDYTRYGEYSVQTLIDRFDGFNKAVKAAGYEPVRKINVSDDELLADVQRVADGLGETPTTAQYSEHGEFHSDTLHTRFGSYNEALEAAGYEPINYPNIPDDDLLADLRDNADERGRAPTVPEYIECGTYTAKTIQERFGIWKRAYEEAGLEPPDYSHLSDEELLAELRRLADGNQAPTVHEMIENGKFSPSPYKQRFGWLQACVRAYLLPHCRVPLRKREYADFVEASISHGNPVKSIIGLLSAFTGLTTNLLAEFSIDWVERLDSERRDTLIVVPSKHLSTTDDWVLKLPTQWHHASTGSEERIPLEELLKWYQGARVSDLDRVSHSHVATIIREIEEIADIDETRNLLGSNLRPSLATHLIRQGAELWRIEMQVGFEYTNWGQNAGIEDYLVWAHQMEGVVHDEYEPEGVFLDPDGDKTT
jgi:hypothetical protein